MLAHEQVVETHFSFSPHVPEPPDRRTAERHIKILRVAALTIEGRRELCLIRNISAGGLMAHVYSTVKLGEQRRRRAEDRPADRRPDRLGQGSQCRHRLRHPRRHRGTARQSRAAGQWLARPHRRASRSIALATLRIDGRPSLARIRRHFAKRGQDRERRGAEDRRPRRDLSGRLPPDRRRVRWQNEPQQPASRSTR